MFSFILSRVCPAETSSCGPAANLRGWNRLPAFLSLGLLHLTCQASEPLFTPHHIAKLRQVTASEISPDGSRIAYLLAVPRDPFSQENGPPFTELHLVNSEGQSRPFITGKVNVLQIGWTPDGNSISYLAKRENDKHRALYLIPVDGGESRKVLEHETDIASYSWSPDGKQVAFLATEAVPEEEKKLREKGFNQEIYEEDFRHVKVWIAGIENENEDEPRALDLPGSASELHWSPGGGQLAVALAPTPLIDDGFMRRIVHIVEAGSGEISARLEHAAKLGRVAWSPDGTRLVTISGEDINDPREGRLFLWSAGGEKIRDLVPDYQGHIWSAAWKDSDTVAFIGYEGVWTVLAEVNRETGDVSKRVEPGGPIWGQLSLSDNGRAAAFLGHSPSHPSELFRLDDEASPERLTDSNPWLQEMQFARQEVITHKARDGLELEGILVRPLNEEAGRRYPVIFGIHGGPEAHIPNGWVTAYSSPGQIAAARGFAVFYPNYRGSTGRGIEFTKLGQRDPAGKEFDDIVDAVDHLIEMGLADKGRIGITGGSYGGYASAWGATYYSERFAASVMFVGLSNLISAYGTTDIAHEKYQVHFRKWLWEDPAFFLERSPIFHVEKARTPLLILHGKDDPRVHPAQSLELHRHLKILDQVPVRLVLYPGEGHGNQRAAARLDYSLRLMRWMEHYLQGPGGDPPPYAVDYEEPDRED